MKPPTSAPAIPRRMVTTSPAGPLPGIRSLAKSPATSPSTTQYRIPMDVPPFRRSLPVALLLIRPPLANPQPMWVVRPVTFHAPGALFDADVPPPFPEGDQHC